MSVFPDSQTPPVLDEVSRGMALEFLANGAEYLVNSRVYTETVTQPALDWEAVHILLRLSREVFEEHVGPSQRVC